MSKSWADKVSSKPAELPLGAGQALAKAASIIRGHRSDLAKELEDPINTLVATAARPEATRSHNQQLISTISYLLSGVGLALGLPRFSEDQTMPPGSPCSLVFKSSRATTNSLALRTRSQDGGQRTYSPALAGLPDTPTPRLQLVESIISAASLDRDQAKGWLAEP